MTLDEATAYIQAHPAMFKGYELNTVLSRIHSIDDPDFYDPTLFVVRDADAAAGKPPAKAPAKAPAPSYTPPKAFSAPTLPSSFPALPVTLAIGLLALGAGFAIYKTVR